jgi:hypothetical protein
MKPNMYHHIGKLFSHRKAILEYYDSSNKLLGREEFNIEPENRFLFFGLNLDELYVSYDDNYEIIIYENFGLKEINGKYYYVAKNGQIQIMKKLKIISIFLIGLMLMSCSNKKETLSYKSFSGIYPHLAYYNNESECGTGAVVPWAGRLWMITYGPHLPFGSSDKLYEITPDLQQFVREESIGGTPANRMIHKESNQLFIGPYAIDSNRNVRVIPYAKMPGRHTGNARHLFYPGEKIYYGTMEEGFYEVDVKTLEVKLLYVDGNVTSTKGEDTSANLPNALIEGVHGKGFYSGQGVAVYSNNGESGQRALKEFDIESGSLSEWDGKEWKMVRRNQFCEVTGPGGIYGNKNPETDPIWATGWDHKSLLLGVRDAGSWSYYRLPKASHSYDGAHGWNTEWPRIRDIGTADKPEYLMTMHGMFWHFPGTFTSTNTSGIRPRSAYLKVIGDFTRWNDKLVFGCDDSALQEFLNKRKEKGNIQGPGQSNSNLWFTPMDQPDLLGPNTAEGAIWLKEKVAAKIPSEPFMFNGWPERLCWVHNAGNQPVEFIFEVDRLGNGRWETLQSVSLESGKSTSLEFTSGTQGEWIRVKTDKATTATVHFSFSGNDNRNNIPDDIFKGLSLVSEPKSTGGLLYGLGDNRRALGVLAGNFNQGQFTETGYYELDGNMNLEKKEDPKTADFIREKIAIPQHFVTFDEASVLIEDDLGRRWRLPLGNQAFTNLTNESALRLCREVVTERDLFNCAGTFYELPANNADGFAKIRPIGSHSFRIHDYASYRGMLIMTGLDPRSIKGNPHIIVSSDGKATVWAGVVDDLWKIGKPVGEGGPWKNSHIVAGVPSDPYLIGFYNKRSLTISHNSSKPVTFIIEAEPIGHGPWMTFKEVAVNPGETFKYKFRASFQSRWIRVVSNEDCIATVWLKYE